MTLTLPRFKADYTATLNRPLAALGMGIAFSPGADFGPMGLQGASINLVLHRQFFEGRVAVLGAAHGGVVLFRAFVKL